MATLQEGYAGTKVGYMRCLDGMVYEFDFDTFCQAVSKQPTRERPLLWELGKRFDTLDDALKYADGMIKFHEFVATKEMYLTQETDPAKRSELENKLETLRTELRTNNFVKYNEFFAAVLPGVPVLQALYDEIYS